MNQPVDVNIEDIFIEDNEAFYNDDMTENGKEYIKSLIHKTNFYNNDSVAYNDNGEDDQDTDFQLDDSNVDADSNNDSDAKNIHELVYVKYVPPPPDSPVEPLHPQQRLKERVKKIRKIKERYRTLTKKKAITFLNKKNAKELLKEHKKELKAGRVHDEITNQYLSDETINYPVDVVESDDETVQYVEPVRE